MVVASVTDPRVYLEPARFFAKSWGSEFVNIGNAGHINMVSGHTRWEDGCKLLQKLEE